MFRTSTQLIVLMICALCDYGTPLGFAQETPDKPQAKQPIAIAAVKNWENFPEWTTAVAFSPDGKTLAVGTYDKIELLQLDDQESRRAVEFKFGYVQSLAYAPDGKSLAVGGYQTVGLIDPASGERDSQRPSRLRVGCRILAGWFAVGDCVGR